MSIFFNYIILLIGLLIATYTDSKTREIPLWDFPVVALIFSLYKFFSQDHVTVYNFIGFVVMFGLFLILCLLGKMGGGDLIMFSCIGYILGIYQLSVYSVCMTITGIPVVYYLYRKNGTTKVETAIAPMACSAYILYLIVEVVILCLH